MSSQTFARLEKLSSLFIFYISQSFSYPSCTLVSLTKTYRLYFSNFLIFLVALISLMKTYWISQASLHLCALSYLWRVLIFFSLRKQPTFGGATTGFPAKWRLRNERRNSILVTCHYPDQGSASDWSCLVGNLIQPIRSTIQVCVVKRHEYGISALVSQTSFSGETSGSVAKCRVFCQAIYFWSVFISRTHTSRAFSYLSHALTHLTSLTYSYSSLAFS